MENLQLENGFMRIANEIVDELFKLPLNSTDQKVIWCVLRYTFGFNRKSHRLSASFIAQWSNCDLRSVKRALRKLQENKIIICMNSEKKGVTAELMFNKNVRQWLITSDKNDTSDGIDTSDKNDTAPVTELTPELVTELTPKKLQKETTNIKTKYCDDFFEKVWRTYPRKLGKSAVTQKAKKELYEAGEEVVLEAVNSYIAEIQENGTAERYIMYGSTFFNSRWRDYVKEPEPRVEVTAEEPEEKRYSAYGRSTKECAENELRIREEIKAGLYNSNKNITLDVYFDEWEKSRRGTIKDSSIKINRSKYNNHIRPVLGKIKVQKIEKRAVVKLQQDLSKKLSASMTNGVIVLLKTVLNAAVDDEILIKNPAASVKPLRKDDRPKASETIHRALTREEQQAFMQEAKTEWLYEFFCFSLCTGMRLNEITALKWQDIDYINNVIRVNKTVSWKEGGGIEETLPKSDTSNRDIPMNDTIKKILQMQKTKMSMVYGEIHARKMDSNIFIGSNGAKAIASSTVSSAIDNVLKRLRQQGIEIERFTHHAFRDTFATRYIEEGGNMQTLQKILGHSSLAMTADLYAHVLPNTKQQEMQQIENGFIGVAVL